jgi:twitching motility two-component system response regulator PilG
MNTISMVSNGLTQRLHPLSLFVQLTSRQASGCLQVTSGTTTWAIFLEQGKLTYAANSVNPFERLDRQLTQMSAQIPGLVSAVRSQVRHLFEFTATQLSLVPADYQAIEWLVEHQYLNEAQLKQLVTELAKEVIESFLLVTEGTHDFVPRETIVGFPNRCQIELRPLVETCQMQLRRTLSRPSLLVSPLMEESNPPEPAQESATEPPTRIPALEQEAPSKPKPRYTIASIDDSPTVLQAMNSFLDDENFAIVTISDPLKALIQVVRCKPDLVLLDVSMPNLDGYELCALLRRHSNFKQTPIVMVTGNTGFIDRAKAKLVGASGYLAKPFTRPELLKMVFKYLK